MSYSSDLLDQAKHLARKEPTRPKQASLRRAVSAAYYALFHFLVSQAALYMVKGAGASDIRPVFQRAFVHGRMKNTAKAFSGGTLSGSWNGLIGGGRIPAELRLIAYTFVNLQEARHQADYDLSRRYSRGEVHDLIERAERAMAAWRNIRQTSEANVFLTALLVYENVSRA